VVESELIMKDAVMRQCESLGRSHALSMSTSILYGTPAPWIPSVDYILRSIRRQGRPFTKVQTTLVDSGESVLRGYLPGTIRKVISYNSSTGIGH